MVTENESQGFAAIETILILVVLGILGFTGWFVWHAKQNTDKSLDAASNSQQVKIGTKKKISGTKSQERKDGDPCELEDGSKGAILTVHKNAFSICQPDGWTLLHTEIEGAFFAPYDSIQYEAGQKPAVKAVGGSDNNYEFSISDIQGDHPSGFTLQNTRKTESGLPLSVYYHATEADDPVGAGIGYLPPRTKQFVYAIPVDSDTLVQITYHVMPEQDDNNKLVEAVAASVQ
jgi:hypothetical protein